MPGAADPAYIAARRALLDVLDALEAHRDAIVVVGAQAIYIHTGEAEFSVAEFTTDADIAIDPAKLQDEPRIEEALEARGFARDPRQPGIWRAPGNVQVDLLVPEALGGGGRRGARLGSHGNHVARKARGLEAALVDNAPVVLSALDKDDPRRIEARVAGPGALLVAKLHKISDRTDDADRLVAKDALDVFRILRAEQTETLNALLGRLLTTDVSRDVTGKAIGYLETLFGTPEAEGCRMAAGALEPIEDPEEIKEACAALARDLLSALEDV